jgi:hypothetical protein
MGEHTHFRFRRARGRYRNTGESGKVNAYHQGGTGFVIKEIIAHSTIFNHRRKRRRGRTH